MASTSLLCVEARAVEMSEYLVRYPRIQSLLYVVPSHI